MHRDPASLAKPTMRAGTHLDMGINTQDACHRRTSTCISNVSIVSAFRGSCGTCARVIDPTIEPFWWRHNPLSISHPRAWEPVPEVHGRCGLARRPSINLERVAVGREGRAVEAAPQVEGIGT